MFTKTTLKNGMRVILAPVEGTSATTVLALTKVGSRYENDAVWGGSHFIEHLMFKGTDKRPTTVDISQTLDRFGAQYNAYTGKDITGYWVKIDSQEASTAIDLLHDMIFHSKYDPEEMEREKKVIIEEIKMYEENPRMHLSDLVEDAALAGSRLGMNIAGTAKSMTDMKREDVIAFRDAHYIPEKMVVVVAGTVEDNILDQLEATFGQVERGGEVINFEPHGDYNDHTEPRVALQTKDVEQVNLAFAWPTVGREHEDRAAIKVLAKILGGAMSSRLFIEVRERRGLCYDVRAMAESYEDIGLMTIRAGLDGKRVTEAAEAIFAEVEKMVTSGVTEEELRYAKDNIAGSIKLALEDSADRAEFYGRQELYDGKVETEEERMRTIEAVTKEDVLRVANEIFNNKRLTVAAIGPYENEQALLSEVGLR